MTRMFQTLTLSRRGLLRLFLALPVVRLVESFLGPVLGTGRKVSMAATAVKVAKLSQLDKPWSTAAFEYFVKVKHKNLKGETVNEEYLPGLVIRLPDELAQKKGKGAKGKFDVVNLHCTHQRCKTVFITDLGEIHALTALKVEHPVFYCPCHRSLFDPTKEGEPMKGSPAKLPLWKFDFEIKGDDILVTGVDPKAATWDPGNPTGLTSEFPVRAGERGL